jgi:hypothetical protein
VRPTISLFKLLIKAERKFKSFSLIDLKPKRIDSQNTTCCGQNNISKRLRILLQYVLASIFSYQVVPRRQLLTASMHGPLISDIQTTNLFYLKDSNFNSCIKH